MVWSVESLKERRGRDEREQDRREKERRRERERGVCNERAKELAQPVPIWPESFYRAFSVVRSST